MKKMDFEDIKNGNMWQWNAEVLSEKTIRFLDFTKIIGNWDENNTVVM